MVSTARASTGRDKRARKGGNMKTAMDARSADIMHARLGGGVQRRRLRRLRRHVQHGAGRLTAWRGQAARRRRRRWR